MAAGTYIAKTRPLSVESKNNGGSLAAQLVTEVDYESQARIVDLLLPTLAEYDLGLLSEESPDSGSRLEKDYFWCIDPLDGTLCFVDESPGYAVSIALVARNGVPHIGVVYDPIEQVLYHAIRGEGAYRNKARWQPNHSQSNSTLTIFTDRSELEKPEFEPIARALQAQWGACGGAVMNSIWCLENPDACYFKLPKQAIGGGAYWDFAATACLFSEAGLWVSDAQGEPLDFNRADSVLMNQHGILFATDHAIAQRFLALRRSP